MTLPSLVATACACGEETRDDPARICAACHVLAKVRELLETAFRFEGDAVAYGTDRDTKFALEDLLEAYDALAE